jgi:hypothetical protein
VLSNGVRIQARTVPRLVIVDDSEDGEWVGTKENRDKTDRWLHLEFIGAMDARRGKLVVVGNLLHMDALLSRLKSPGTGFKVLEFSLFDARGVCTWRDVPYRSKSQGKRARHGRDCLATRDVAPDRWR